MKEIGEKLRLARESMGISIEEASEDLKIRPSQLQNIEDGNKESFKDIFYLKYFIRDYSKYLGLDYEEMVEEFNEFLFDYTSKISVEDIKNADKKHNKDKTKNKKIVSPYTIERRQQHNVPRILIIGAIVLSILLIIYFIVVCVVDKDEEISNSIVYGSGGVVNEFA